jgi:hypothetical protein
MPSWSELARWGLCAVLVAHGGIHLMGLVKAFGWAELPRLSQPISRGAGLAWAAAALLLVGTAVLFLAGARLWWALALVAVVLSQALIVSAWSDAKFGTIANVLIAAAALYAVAMLPREG